MVTWTHLTQHPKLDRFRRFCTTHGRESLYFTIGHHSHPPSKLLLHMEDLDSHLIHSSLGHPSQQSTSRSKWHLGPSSHLATTNMDRKLGRLCPLFGGGARSSSNTMCQAEAYLRTKWHLDPSSRLVTTDGPKIGAVPLLESWVPI